MDKINCTVEILNTTGKTQVVRLTAALVDGWYNCMFTMDPAGAIALGDALTRAGTQAKTGLVTPSGSAVQPRLT